MQENDDHCRDRYILPEDQKPYYPMKNLACLATLLLPALLWAMPAAASPNPFVQGSLEEIQQQSADDGKLYFLLFTADYVMTCTWMEEETFADPELLDYLDEAYLGMKVNINAMQGKALQQQYDVTHLPSILVFSCRGQLLGRHQGAVPANELLEKLKAYDRPAFRQPIQAKVVQAELLPSPQPILTLFIPRLVPDAPPAQQPVYKHKYSPVKEQATHRTHATYFTVQLGVFGSEDNAQGAIAQLEKQCPENIRVVEGQSNGSPVYRLYAGSYANREQAKRLQYRLQDEGVESFVKLLHHQGAQ